MPKGGLARRATAMEQQIADAEGTTVLILDAGSTLDGQWAARQSLGGVLVESMSALGYDALVLGRMDISLGIEALLERADEAEFAILSANLVKSDGTPYFDPYVIIERDGLKIGIIGLTERDALESPAAPKDATVLDPVQVAAELVAELRPQVDLLVLLSHIGLPEDIALAEAVQGIDLIVGGNTRQLMREPEREGNTLIIQQGYRGEWLGVLKAEYDERGVPSNYVAEAITLDDSFADQAEMVELLQTYRAKFPSPTPRPTSTLDPRTPTANMTETVQVLKTQAALMLTATAVASAK